MEKIKNALKTKFQFKFQVPEDFLGVDIKIHSPGDIELSMRTFSKKMIDALQINDNARANIYTPGRTDCKIIKSNDDDKTNADDKDDGTHRSKVGSLNWLIMCLRYDMVYATKELSRVLSSPTPLARSPLQRALLCCAKRTAHATLRFRCTDVSSFTPPPTRKKPTDLDASLHDFVDEHSVDDGIPQVDDDEMKQDYLHDGVQMTITCQKDIDLAGQVETQQSASGFMLHLDGTLMHWRGPIADLDPHLGPF